MPQSSSKVIFHIIFSTKDRHSWLDANVRPRMHAYLATVCRDAGAKAFRVGGAFSVSPSQANSTPLLEYVKTQEEHHRSPTFQEEYHEFLHKHGVEYDERYAWD